MKKHLLTFFMMSFVFVSLHAQRYVTPTFTDVTVESDILFGVNANILGYSVPSIGEAIPQALKMDIYHPTGDTETARPVAIIVPAGSYLPHPQNGGVAQNMRNDLHNLYMADQLAKMGYVAVIIDLRLGWNPLAPTQEERATGAVQAAVRQCQDLRTAIRFLRKSAADGGNPYGIDPDKICAWGDGSGFAPAAFAAYTKDYQMDFLTNSVYITTDADGNPLPMWIEQVHGDLYGETVGVNPGNGDTLSYPNHPGISSDFNLVVQMGAAVSDTFSIDKDDAAMISFKTVAGGTTPWWDGISTIPNIGPIIAQLGAGSIHTRINNVGTNDAMRGVTFVDAISQNQATLASGFPDLYPEEFPELYPLLGGKGTPWVFWDAATNANTAAGLALSDNDADRSKLLIDTMMQFFAPRACLQMGLPCDLDGIVSSTEEILDAAATGLQIAPNPAQDFVMFESSNEFPIEQIYVYDMNGRLVKAHTHINANQFRMERNVLTNGIYFAKIKFEEGVVTQKIVFSR